MGVLFGATSWAGWLGWQWRRTRTIGDDIKALKAQLPKPAAGETEAPAAPAALTQQISALEKVCAYRSSAVRSCMAQAAATCAARWGSDTGTSACDEWLAVTRTASKF